jgi:superfamily I DNA/RNA helicase
MSADHLAEPNIEQRRVIEYGVVLEPPSCPSLLVMGGAGLGKPHALAQCVAALSANGVEPGFVLMLVHRCARMWR